MGAILSLEFGVVLHRSYNSQHVDHFHVDLSLSVAWRKAESQIKLIQQILNCWYNNNLIVDGRLGARTTKAWEDALSIVQLEPKRDFIALLTKTAKGI
jgi:peptidoglycan hydrolase-like protein with peptidoglycan-binding domain